MKFGPKFLLTFHWTLFFFLVFFLFSSSFLLSSIMETGVRVRMTSLPQCHKSHNIVMVTGHEVAIEESRKV